MIQMSKIRKAKYEVILEVMKSRPFADPDALGKELAAERGMKISGITCYLIMMLMVEEGILERYKESRKWLYRLVKPETEEETEVPIEEQIGQEPDDPEATTEALKMAEESDEVCPL